MRGLARFRTGAKVKEFTEAPWGDAVADTGLVVRYHFAGREYDGESGLYYMRARYYDPALGRWISEDPIGIAGGLNVYAYAGNDPVNLTDPSGLDPDCKPIDVPPGPGQIPGIGQECKRPWNPFGPGGPLEWLDPSNECGMDVFHDPECSGYPDQDVLDYYSGLGGAEGDGGQTVDGPTAGLDPWASATGWATELIGCPATANGPLRFVTPSNWWVGIVPVPVTTRYTLWRKTKAGGVARYSGRAEIETRFSIGETVLVGSRTLQIAGTVTCAVGTFDFEAWDVGT